MVDLSDGPQDLKIVMSLALLTFIDLMFLELKQTS